MDIDKKDDETRIAVAAQAFGDKRRVRILMALLDGRSLPVTRLALEAGVAPSTASAHLKRLVDAELLTSMPPPPHHGHHRFYRLASREVAELCESFAALVPHQQVRSLQPGTREAAIRSARTCYDHVAGRLGVALMDALIEQDWLVPHDAGFALSDTGEVMVERFGVDLPALRAKKRPLIRDCVDWTEQRPHLSGGLGSALRDQFERRAWVMRSPADRSLIVTAQGRDGFRLWIGLEIEE